MIKTLVLLDISNLYYTCNKRFKRKLDYFKLKALIGDGVYKAYASEMNGQGNKFLDILRNLGFEVITKPVKKYYENGKINEKANMDIELCIDAIKNKCEQLILCSSDGDMVPLVKYLQEQNVNVKVIGCALNTDLRQIANSWNEIDEPLLEEVT